MKNIVAAILFFAAQPLLAQGSGSTEPVPRAGAAPEWNFIVTKTVDATILEISPNVIVVKEVNKKGVEKVYELRYDSRLEVRADKKTVLGQTKKKIDRSDLKAGDYVRITWRADDQVAVHVRVIPAKPA